MYKGIHIHIHMHIKTCTNISCSFASGQLTPSVVFSFNVSLFSLRKHEPGKSWFLRWTWIEFNPTLIFLYFFVFLKESSNCLFNKWPSLRLGIDYAKKASTKHLNIWNQLTYESQMVPRLN